LSEPTSPAANPGPSRGSVAAVVVTVSLLALLVWRLNPRQPDFKPAPLLPPSTDCLKPGRDFVPTNLTAISDPALEALPTGRKNPAIFRLNTTPCTCGCQLSVAYCREMNSECANAKQGIKQIVSEASAKIEHSPGKKY
jgi:hypothetical protein